jgi:hypothetical protein
MSKYHQLHSVHDVITFMHCGCIAMDVEILPQLQLTDAPEIQSLERVFLLLQFFLPLHNQCIQLIHYECIVSEMHCLVHTKKPLLADFIFSHSISGVIFYFMVPLVMTPEIMPFYFSFYFSLKQFATMGTNILIFVLQRC